MQIRAELSINDGKKAKLLFERKVRRVSLYENWLSEQNYN